MYKTTILLLFVFVQNILLKAQNNCEPQRINFKDGEQVKYEIYYQWHALWVNAGYVNFSIKDTVFLGKQQFLFRGYGRTYKKYDWIYKVRDHYYSIADKKTLKPSFFKRIVNEGDLYILEQYLFKNNKAIAYYKENSKPPKKDTLILSTCVFDVMTMVYYARCIDFNQFQINDTIPISMIIDNKIHHTYIRYLGKETIKTKNKETYSCIKFKPMLIEGTIFHAGESMTVWATDDEQLVPVLIETPILVGKIKVFLDDIVN
ncbi:MAG: DUF3108 domain-containing protein [Vicingaceae bacterium]